ncbi:MAG: hypothetical protein KA419_11425 [Acidobacteria bacterium]|nr:hypothetical protein [Acidobacteriota bacterium]
MIIANPIYDVVFKYLMDDNRVARLFLSAILGEQIESLEFRPQERSFFLEKRGLTVYRLDFSARIRTSDGSFKQVILEVQKAKFPSDIMRFRKYLGDQYGSDDNVHVVREGSRERKQAVPLVSIYFLGHMLERVKAPVVRIRRTYTDAATGEEILERDEFIESLTHDSVVIQIPALKEQRRTELEALLSVFDQSRLGLDHHFLNVDPGAIPPKYRAVLRRLQAAAVEPEVRQTMEAEDDILEELDNLDRSIARLEEEVAIRQRALERKEDCIAAAERSLKEKADLIAAAEKALAEKEDLIAAKNEVIAEKVGVIAEKEGVIAEKEGVIAEKEGVIAEKEGVIAEKEGVIAEKEGAISVKEEELKQQQREIEALRARLAELTGGGG